MFRLLVFALPIEQRRESGHIGCCIRVVRALRALTDFDSQSCVGLASGVAPARVIDAAEVVVEIGAQRIKRPEFLLYDFQRASIDAIAFIKPSRVLVQHS